MISMDRKYKTRDGSDVRILCVDRDHPSYTVVGLLDSNVLYWASNGRRYPSGYEDRLDLIEVKPRIQRTVWFNIYSETGGMSCHESRKSANNVATLARLACVKVKIDVEEGHGLKDS